MKKRTPKERPSVELLEAELQRVTYRQKYHTTLKSTVCALITVTAIAVLAATLWLPVFQIYGSSMAPTLSDGDILFSMKTADPEPGDIVAFYYNSKILVKRVIAKAGDWVDMEADGTVTVNSSVLEEPYLEETAPGNTDIQLPYQVPPGSVFVMGDHRTTSVDSRNSAVGCISQDQILGKILLRIWPLTRFGGIS